MNKHPKFPRTSLKLPKTAKVSNEEKIQDLCTFLDGEEKKKLDVRSIYESDGRTIKGERSRPTSASSTMPKYQSAALSRSQTKFSKSSLHSARARIGSKLKQNYPVVERKIIDLTSIHDALQLAQKYYKEIGISDGEHCQDNKMKSYLADFVKADLTFPKLWPKEMLLECANELAVKECVVPPVTNNNEKLLAERNRRISQNTQGKHVRIATDLFHVFYSDPVKLKRRKATNLGSKPALELPRLCQKQLERRRKSWQPTLTKNESEKYQRQGGRRPKSWHVT